MKEFKHFPALLQDGTKAFLTVVSGPVIIEKGKVLLVKHGSDNFWKFPGGAHRTDDSFEQGAIREVKEELGIEVEFQGDPLMIVIERDHKGKHEYVVLCHYLAKRKGDIKPWRDIEEWAWHDVKKLSKGFAPNIRPAVEYFLK